MKIKPGKATSIPKGLGISLTITMIMTLAATALIALMIKRETIKWESIGYWIMAALLISSFIGGKIAINSIKTQKHLVSLMSGTLYWMCLLCITALLFGGHYHSVLETGALIIGGSTVAALIEFPKKLHLAHRKHRSYR